MKTLNFLYTVLISYVKHLKHTRMPRRCKREYGFETYEEGEMIAKRHVRTFRHDSFSFPMRLKIFHVKFVNFSVFSVIKHKIKKKYQKS